MTQLFQSELITWATVQRLSKKLAMKIQSSSFRPDIIVGIARGGYVPARILCDYLDIYELSSIRITHYTAGAEKRQKAYLAEGLSKDLSGKRVLLVDDVSDSGVTLELASNHLHDCGAESVRMAVLHHKHTSTIEPDYYGVKIIKWRWIIYPWAVKEDLTGFIKHMPHRPADSDEAVKMLKDYCGLKVQKDLVDEIMSGIVF